MIRSSLLLAALVLAAPASAEAASTVVLSSTAAQRAEALGARSTTVGAPATASGGRLRFPAVEGTTPLRTRGTLVLRTGRRTLTLGGLQLNLGTREVALSASVAGRRTVLVRGRPASGALKATPRRLAATALKTTPVGASLLARALGGRTRAGHTAFTLSVEATSSTPTAPTLAPTPAPAAAPPAPVAAPAATATTPTTTGPAPAPDPPPVTQPTPPTTPPDPDPDPDPTTPPAATDPYTDRCTIPADGAAHAAPAAPSAPLAAPTFTDPMAVTGTFTWGVKESFRSYVASFGGTVTPWEDATGTSVFTFPVAQGQQDGTRAVAPAAGAVVFCLPPHGFRISVLHPTVTIDGTASRLTADVERNEGGTWLGSHRVDFATLDLSGVTPVRAGANTTWRAIPTTLTAAGAEAFDGFYSAGTPLDAVTVNLTTGP